MADSRVFFMHYAGGSEGNRDHYKSGQLVHGLEFKRTPEGR